MSNFLSNEYGNPLTNGALGKIDIMYLRKSREDAEAEKYGEGETLTRHYNILCELAKRHGIVVSDDHVFREVASGESIHSRPEMQKVLSLVESGIVRNVLVVDIDRLSRGSSRESGYIMDAFRLGNCKIITQSKVYDLSNDSDEQFTDMQFLFARYELKSTNTRLIRGRVASTNEGKFTGSTAPYGYDRVKLQNAKGYSLVPNENAKYIKMIYEWVLQGNGAIHIAKMLQDIGAPTMTGGSWSSATVRNILHNKTYCGYVSWGRRKTVKSFNGGIVSKTRKRNDKSAEYFKGLHEPIIDEETWLKAQEMREKRALPSCNDNKNGLRNPLAGIVKCGKCGRTMQINTRQNKRIRLRCPNFSVCNCGSIYIDAVEVELIEQLKDWLNGYSATVGKETQSISRATAIKDMIANLSSESVKITAQIDKACDLLEQGIYDKDMFISRSETLKNRQLEIKEKLSELEIELETINATDSHIQSLPKVQKILDNYFDYDTKTKNMLLKEILDHAVFTKEPGTSLVKDDSFELEIFPILPRK